MAGSNATVRPRPSFMAGRSARPARRISASALVPSVGAPARPLLAPSSTSCPSSQNGAAHRVDCGLRVARRQARVAVDHDDRELVAAETADQGGLRQRGLDARADRGKQGVARAVAVHVVHFLEAVEIDEREGHALIRGAGLQRAMEMRQTLRRLGRPVISSSQAPGSATHAASRSCTPIPIDRSDRATTRRARPRQLQ